MRTKPMPKPRDHSTAWVHESGKPIRPAFDKNGEQRPTTATDKEGKRVSTLSERTLVHCSVNQAASHLIHYFQARGNADGDVARLSLRAEVPLPGSPGAMRFERTAIATITARNTPGGILPHYGVTWAPEHAGPYPTFSGDLAIESGDDYDSFYLVLKGSYEPPLGAVGAAFDAVVGHRIAEMTARNLIATIADSIETDFGAVESAKLHTRSAVSSP
jgi:hypothetical protein